MAKRYVGFSVMAMALGFAFVSQPKVGPEPAPARAVITPVLPAVKPARLPASENVVVGEPAQAASDKEEVALEEAEYRRDRDYELNTGDAVIGVSLEEMARARRRR